MTCSKRIPLHHVTGNHYECGYAIGQLTKSSIEQRIEDDQAYLSSLFTFVQTGLGQKLHEGFVDVTRSQYPWYLDELRGLADGSGISFEKILVLNFLNETRTAYRLESERIENETGEKGCTTVLINRREKDLFSILHNEDHAVALYETAYLIHADIQSSSYDDGQRQSPREKFLAYCYAGGIAGNAFNVNHHGFAYTVNGLYPNFIAQGRLPRQIVNRALLSVQNEAELDQILNSSSVAYGFCINAGFSYQQDYLLNYEIGPNLKLENTNYVSKCRIIDSEEKSSFDDDSCERLNYLVHYNHYERLDDVIVQQKALESSRNRWTRGQTLGEIKDIDDAIQLLGDHENSHYPIFRSVTKKESNSCTLCTVHIDFRQSKLIIYEENPKETNQASSIFDIKNLFE